MDTNNRQKTALFPTIIYSFDINTNLVKQIDKIVDDEYRFWFNAKPYISTSEDDQHLRKEECFQQLNKIILEETSRVLDDMKVVRKEHYITGMWHNVSSEPYRHHQHIHPNSFLSGLLYVRAPKGAGNTIFSDPRTVKHTFLPDLSEFTLENTPAFEQPPREGLVLIFPSWLHHCVDWGTMHKKDKRITTAFNIHIHGEATLKTARWNF